MTPKDIVNKYYEIEQLEGGLALADPAKVKSLTAQACGVTEQEVSRVMLDELTMQGAG